MSAGDDAVWRSQDREVLTAISRLARIRAELDAVHLQLVRQVDARGVAEAHRWPPAPRASSGPRA